MTLTLSEKLEALGFLNMFTRRIGPCFQCEEEKQTFYNITLKRWYCEECWYDTDFISELMLYSSRKNMSQDMQAILARLEAAEAELKKVKASREDNVFVGTTDNLTLKHRAINPKAWGVPTKSQNGQGYFRCSDFPMTFDLRPDNKAVRVYTEIPVDDRQAQLFRDRFISQQLVVAKRRQQKDDGQATTPSIPSTPSASVPVAAVATAPTVSTASTTRSFSSLSPAEQQGYIAKAQQLFSIPGLFKDLQSALQSVLQPANISLP